MTTCRFALDDGAYVLGALAPSERAEFERHLPGCPSCRKAVASLAVLPGLLSRLDAATVNPAVIAPPSLVPRTLRAVAARRQAERRRRRWYAVAAAVVSIALATAVGITVRLAIPPTAAPVPPTATLLTAMRPAVEQVPVSAEIGLASVEGGTRIDMNCRYEEDHEGRWTVRLVVFPMDGSPAEQVGSWTAASGQEVTVSARTHLTPAEIGRIELQRSDRIALLVWTRT